MSTPASKTTFIFLLCLGFFNTQVATAQDNTNPPPRHITQFVPRPASLQTLDYRIWSKILDGVVVSTGSSTRRRLSRRPAATLGSRIKIGTGHSSPYRMEGNRIVFSQMSDGWQKAIIQYSLDLEKIGNEINIQNLPRNEQLAYWLNLHNATLIAQIAQQYPIKIPSKMMTGQPPLPLHDAKIINIKGTSLSLRDIREKIVYPNWDNPLVLYGFFLGNIGSPSIQKYAYTGDNVYALLRFSAGEFINSLRGVHRWDNEVRISQLYFDTQKFYFKNFQTDLKNHLLAYARDNVADEIGNVQIFTPANYQYMIADIAGGVSIASENAIKLFSAELNHKYRILEQQGRLSRGSVIIEDIPTNP